MSGADGWPGTKGEGQTKRRIGQTLQFLHQMTVTTGDDGSSVANESTVLIRATATPAA